jgi:HPt (histidine-containing phosphotransfer) domain-containing protein
MAERYFDIALLNKRTGYDPDVMREMFEIFRDTYPEYFEMCRDAINNKDWVKLSETAHRTKSSVAIMGMENLRQEFNQLETLSAKAEETDTYQAWLDELREKVDIAVRQIQEYLDNKN